MKTFAIFGSHGVGKTTTITKIKSIHPEWKYISESTRHIIPLLGYDDPYKYVADYGIAFYENMIISQWCILDKEYNIFLKNSKDTILVDRCPIDNFAYYLIHRNNEELKYENILKELTNYYINFISHFIYIPPDVFDLKPDKMQLKETQTLLDETIKRLLTSFEIHPYKVKSKSINSRAGEIIEFITNNST